jgi:hypothetical protein
MAANIMRFNAWPTNGALVLCIEFGDSAQVTMELELSEVEELLKAIDQALGPGGTGTGPIASFDP